MSHQFGWNSSVAGLVQSSFFWGYALSQLPGGWLAKIFGGRSVLETENLNFVLFMLPIFLLGYVTELITSCIKSIFACYFTLVTPRVHFTLRGGLDRETLSPFVILPDVSNNLEIILNPSILGVVRRSFLGLLH